MNSGKRQVRTRKLLGAEQSATRDALVRAAIELIRDEGYAAATARGIARRAGLKHQVIFYYFDDVDDLLVTAYRKGAQAWLERLKEGLRSQAPLRSFWAAMRDPQEARFLSEYTALAHRKPAIGAEMSRYAAESRALLVEQIERSRMALEGVAFSAMEITFVMSAVARLLVSEETADFFAGHDEAERFVGRLLDRLEPTPS